MKNIDLNFYPGWTRKAITFTIDDGWLEMDRKFLSIVRPYGVKGTFNISSHNATKHNDPTLIHDTYLGYEIANHVRLHPLAFKDGDTTKLTDETFKASTADKSLGYREAGSPEGVYLCYRETPNLWSRFCTAEGYITLVKECQQELEEIFGEGGIRGFVWPYCRQENAEVIEYLKANYYGLRDAGKTEPMEDASFSLPLDRSNWHYNARHSNLLARAKEYEALGDTQKLTWFCFGVHSVDFDRAQNWHELEEFCKSYGNRPEDYYYATNAEIFDYEDAVKAVIVEDGVIKNPTDKSLFIKVDGKRLTLCPKSEIEI